MIEHRRNVSFLKRSFVFARYASLVFIGFPRRVFLPRVSCNFSDVDLESSWKLSCDSRAGAPFMPATVSTRCPIWQPVFCQSTRNWKNSTGRREETMKQELSQTRFRLSGESGNDRTAGVDPRWNWFLGGNDRSEHIRRRDRAMNLFRRFCFIKSTSSWGSRRVFRSTGIFTRIFLRIENPWQERRKKNVDFFSSFLISFVGLFKL